jgi:hypothetical protein
MNIQDIYRSPEITDEMKDKLREMLAELSVNDEYLQVLVPTEENNDVNGSQHGLGGETVYFTYQDATITDVREAVAAGVYDYFGAHYSGGYTGHYYDGAEDKFQAIVFDPPAYAATHRF